MALQSNLAGGPFFNASRYRYCNDVFTSNLGPLRRHKGGVV